MMASLAELTDNPFVQNTIDSVALRDATDLPKTRIIVRPQNTPDNEPVKQDDSKLQNIIDKLFGLNGKERYQLWPEFTNRAFGSDLEIYKDGERPANGLIDLAQQAHLLPSDKYNVFKDLSTFVKDPLTGIANDIRSVRRLAKGFADSIVSGVTAPQDAIQGKIPAYTIDENGDIKPSDEIIHRAMDMAGLAGSGGLAGAGSEAGVALGSAPFLRPALKYGEKLYKGKPGQQHMDVIPADLYPTFQKQAMSGEDISNFNFGFLNHKGQFLSREDALKYAIDNGLVDPHSAQYGALTSTLMSDSAKPGAALAAVANTYPLAKPSDRWMNTLGQNDHLIQNMTPDEFLNKSRPLKVDAESRENIDALKQHIQEGKPLDPLELHANGKEDGRHRAIAAKELGIKEVPVINYRPVKPFYSAVENAVAAAKQPKADAQQWLSFLKNQPGVKQEELAHLGLDKLQGSITKDDLLKAVQEGQPQIKEVMKGDPTKVSLDEALAAHGRGEPIFATDRNNANSVFKVTNDKGEILPYVLNNKDKYDFRLGSGSDFESGKLGTKYHSYQLPGGENYREMLLTLPRKEITTNDVSQKLFKRDMRNLDESERQAVSDEMRRLYETKEGGVDYKSSHWDEPNVLAHIRMNDRTIDGKKTLHLEEIQSDWHQAGRKQGYKQDNKNKLSVKNEGGIWRVRDENGQRVDLNGAAGFTTEEGARNAIANDTRDIGGVPDAPFKKTWDELALKKAITEAVKNGYDQISWTPGEAQAARYDLSKQVDKIAVPMVNQNGTRSVRVDAKGGSPFKLMVNKDGIVEGHGPYSSQFSGKPLSDVVGKEMAEKIMKLDKPDEFSGDGLKVGGQGMKAFYDKMLVDKMNALTKKYGGKVEKGELPPKLSNKIGEPFIKQPIHVLKITPELREHVLKKGFPLFSAGVPVFTPVDHDPFKEMNK